MLLPDEEAGQRLSIEKLADEISELAVEAEQGAGSYQRFEAILAGLHTKGKFLDNSAVSAVASAFTE